MMVVMIVVIGVNGDNGGGGNYNDGYNCDISRHEVLNTCWTILAQGQFLITLSQERTGKSASMTGIS